MFNALGLCFCVLCGPEPSKPLGFQVPRCDGTTSKKLCLVVMVVATSIRFHYITSHCITLHYITLRYITHTWFGRPSTKITSDESYPYLLGELRGQKYLCR